MRCPEGRCEREAAISIDRDAFCWALFCGVLKNSLPEFAGLYFLQGHVAETVQTLKQVKGSPKGEPPKTDDFGWDPCCFGETQLHQQGATDLASIAGPSWFVWKIFYFKFALYSAGIPVRFQPLQLEKNTFCGWRPLSFPKFPSNASIWIPCYCK